MIQALWLVTLTEDQTRAMEDNVINSMLFNLTNTTVETLAQEAYKDINMNENENIEL